MIKVIENIELLKKLAPYLWKTEYIISDDWWVYSQEEVKEWLENQIDYMFWWLKTLTTDELFTLMWKAICHFNMPYPNAWQLNWWTVIWDEEIKAKDLNEYFGKCVEYLIDNNLLPKD